MKKVILKEKVSEIHVSDINSDNIILVKSKGNIIGTIVCDSDDQWFCKLNTGWDDWEENISELLSKPKIKDYEFYVLD